VIRATFISAVDQALLSALNLGLAFLLIHFASKQDYGLYSELINLQALFSPLHAGVFVSAYLALASKMDTAHHAKYRGAMAQAEVATTVASAFLVISIGVAGGRFFNPNITTGLSVAFAAALLGLWWREFVRQTRFASFLYGQALNIDGIYCISTAVAVGVLVGMRGLSAESALWCMAIGAAISVTMPLTALVRGAAIDLSAMGRDLAMSWNVGRWEVVGSFVTWGYAQSYIYFAAVHGGLDGAAEIAASRLLGSPLALMWAAYSNVLRPNASTLFARGSAGVGQLAWRSVWLVLALSMVYGALIYQVIPLLGPTLFAGKFPMLRPLSMWWIGYFTLTGVTTIATGILRSALEFRRIFHLQVFTSVAAVALLTVSLRSSSSASLVIAMILGEGLSAVIFWKSVIHVVSRHHPTKPGPSQL
jgi:hypothetical protein